MNIRSPHNCKNFLQMGAVCVACVYGLQGAAVVLHNEYVNASHDMALTSLYNHIWPQIHQKDMHEELLQYQRMAAQGPVNYEFGWLPTAVSRYSPPPRLPLAPQVEASARELNKKLRLF